MRRNTTTITIGDAGNNNRALRVDHLDLKIIAALVAGKNNKEISSALKVPLSTIQRRTRRLFEKEAVRASVQPNFAKLAMRKGVVHLYINNADATLVCQALLDVTGVTSASVHIGNSDVVGEIIYRDGNDVLQIIANCKRIEGVTRVVWSEEVYNTLNALSERKILSYFKMA